MSILRYFVTALAEGQPTDQEAELQDHTQYDKAIGLRQYRLHQRVLLNGIKPSPHLKSHKQSLPLSHHSIYCTSQRGGG